MEDCISQLLILIDDSISNIKELLVKEESEKVREILMQHTKALEMFKEHCQEFMLLHKLMELIVKK